MANKIVEQKLIDSTKRALLKYVMISDGTAEANSTLVDVSSLAFSLNANGYIMQSNTHPLDTYRTSIARIWGYSAVGTPNTHFRLQWHNTIGGGVANSEIVVIGGAGPFDFNFDVHGGGAIPIPGTANTGDILLTTSRYAANDTFTLFIDLKKDAGSFDAGQTADPAAFNRGNRAP